MVSVYLRLSNNQCFQYTFLLTINHDGTLNLNGKKVSKTVDCVLVKEALSHSVLIPTPTGLWYFRLTLSRRGPLSSRNQSIDLQINGLVSI